MLPISSRAVAIRQRSWRRFLCAYMLPIRDLCATAFCVLLSFVRCRSSLGPTTSQHGAFWQGYLYYYRRAALKILTISSRAVAIRQRSWRRFLCAYMLPIRDLCATAFCVLLSFVRCRSSLGPTTSQHGAFWQGYLYYYRRAVLKILRISSRAVAIRQRSWRRFLCAYMLPIRDLCATAFCVLLSFVFYEKKKIKKIWHFATDAMFTLRN